MYLRLALNLLHSHDDLEFRILLPPTSDYWDYKHVLPCLVYVMLVFKPRALYILVKDISVLRNRFKKIRVELVSYFDRLHREKN